jgi:tetratricopeptide (TPR) repeat protein
MKRKVSIVLILACLVATPVYAGDARHYFNLGLESSMTRKKIKYYTKALELDPKFAAAYEKRGLLYYYQREYKKVIQDYHAYLDLAPAKAEAYRMLGIGYLKSGLYEPAIDSFSQALELEPDLIGAYAFRAEAYRLSGRDKEAIRDSTKAVNLRGDPRARADAFKTRAKIYRKNGHIELAVADSRAAISIDPRIPRFWGRRYFYSYASPEELSKAGLFALIGIAFIFIFKLRLKPPKKDD